jgi:hypothetical protein
MCMIQPKDNISLSINYKTLNMKVITNPHNLTAVLFSRKINITTNVKATLASKNGLFAPRVCNS